jgi:hypothetical protein
MQKLLLILLSLLFFAVTNSQSQEILKQYPVKKGPKDEIFDKAFSAIIASSIHNFKSLQNDQGIKSVIDTSYDVKFNFKEKNEGRLTCEKNDVSLSIRFALDYAGLNTFLNHLMASLPVNFVYTLEYDALAKQSNYTFFSKPGSKTTPSNYPEKIYLTADVNNTVVLGFLIYR